MEGNFIHIDKVVALIKSMPTDQAIQKIKSILSGLPETTVIDGDLFVILKKNDN